jgi:hypothetical protein
VLFRENEAWWAAGAAGIAACAGALTRYEGWILIPPLALYFLIVGKSHRLRSAFIFGAVASLGPLAWMAHCWYWFGDPLDFYRGASSAVAIQGGKPYAGYHNWTLAALYYRTAVTWCTGPALRWIGAIGILAALFRKSFWPLILLTLPGAFYVWSMHSSGGTPIHVPNLWPFSYYNTRYGLALLPLAAFAGSALVTLPPAGLRKWAAGLVIAASITPWLLHPTPENWITWKESQVNSDARREWTRQAAEFLAAHYGPGDGIFTTFGDITGIFRNMGVPLHRTLTWDNNPQWLVTTKRPDLFLWERWAVCQGGDPVQMTIHRALRRGPYYDLVARIVVKDAQVLEIYKRSLPHANSLH